MTPDLLDILAGGAAAIGSAGGAQALVAWQAVRRFARAPAAGPARLPPVTILKPLHGDEPLLEDALASCCDQDYPEFQIVFGVQDPNDPALAVLRRLRARFPDVDMEVVVDSTAHGSNRKIANLINMFPSAKHDVLVIADSDIHAAPDYLRRLVAALERPGTGLVTTLYTGLPGRVGLASELGALQISHSFLPGAVLARAMGRRDCLGATMALRRTTLARIGGLTALVHHLADDAVLGHLVRRQGLEISLADTVPATTVPEERLADLFRHELRWGRTIQSLAPVGFALSALQFPLFWAGLAVLLSGVDQRAAAVFGVAWLARAAAAWGIERALRLETRCAFWLLPLRDLMSVCVILASYAGREVHWRGHLLSAAPPSLAPGEG